MEQTKNSIDIIAIQEYELSLQSFLNKETK